MSEQISAPGREVVGVDAGASLVKIAHQPAGGGVRYALYRADEHDRVVEALGDLAPSGLGLTGAGAVALSERLPRSFPQPVHVPEFEAWRIGASRILEEIELLEGRRSLLVSLGTGTSVLLLLEGDRALRVGGTALGGGTLLGLGRALTGVGDFAELCKLADRGRRGQVDLQIADIYPGGEISLPGEATASSFAKLALPNAGSAGTGPSAQPDREDLAAAVFGLVGENVALICGGIAAATGADQIVYAGSTLRDNPVLRAVLRLVTAGMGHRATFLPGGEFAGARGAREAALGAPNGDERTA